MTAEMWFLAVLLAGALFLFWTQWLRTDVTALLVMVLLMLPWKPTQAGPAAVLEPREAFSGFGSSAVIMVVAMFVVSAAMVRTGAADFLGKPLLRACAREEWGLQACVLIVVTLFSSVVNDTTSVLVWMPLVIAVCNERNLSPSRYLILVAYGSLLGGQVTLIGTRSNIIIDEFLRSRTRQSFGFFEFTPVAAVIFCACLVFFLLIGRRFVPEGRPEAGLVDTYNVHEFLTEVMITPRASIVGTLLAEAHLQDRFGVEVIEVLRGDERLPPTSWTRLKAGDTFIVKGRSSQIAALMSAPEFEIREEIQVGEATLRSVDLMMAEAMVLQSSSLIGRSIEAAGFLKNLGLSVMAVARRGRPLEGRLGSALLHFGDSILLFGHRDGIERLRGHPDLRLIESSPFPIVERWKGLATLGIMVVMVACVAGRVLDAAVAIPAAALGVILLGCLTMRAAYESIDWRAVVVVGAMIPYGVALTKTGASQQLAVALVGSMSHLGAAFLLGALLLVSVVLTQVIENAAVAVILAPIAFELALQSGMSPRPVLLALAISISASFLTPVAHESTILVMGPGRYTFKNYIMIGAGFAFLTWLGATLVPSAIYSLSASR